MYLIIVNENEISNMLYSILVVTSAVFGALNLHLYLKGRHTQKLCKELTEENERLKLELHDYRTK